MRHTETTSFDQQAGAEQAPDAQQPPEDAGVAYPPGAEPGALQFRPIEEGHLFGTQDADGPPANMTYRERMGSTAHTIDEYGMPQWRPAGHPAGPEPGVVTAGAEGVPDPGQGSMPVQPDEHPSAWHRLGDAVHHGWHRISAAADKLAHRSTDGRR